MHQSQKIRVLIVDDDFYNGDLLSMVLSIEGFDPIWVSDGVDALKSIDEQRPDVLLTDIEMPRKDGITLIKDVRKRKDLQNLPIVAMSGRHEKLKDAEIAGAAFWFTKPFADLAAIVDKIKELFHAPLISNRLCDAI